MAKLVVFLMVTVVLAIQGAPPASYDAIIKAASEGKWDIVQSVLSDKYENHGWQPDIASVRELKPEKGGHVFGESELTFHSSLDQGGSKVQNSAGHKIINNDGLVKEFDFTPSARSFAEKFQELNGRDQAVGHIAEFDGRPVEFGLAPPLQGFSEFKPAAREGKSSAASEYSFDDVRRAAEAGQLGSAHILLADQLKKMLKASTAGVRELKPVNGGHVFAESAFTFHSSSNVDGKETEKSGGHKFQNNDGQLKEFQFTPSEQDIKKLIELTRSDRRYSRSLRGF